MPHNYCVWYIFWWNLIRNVCVSASDENYCLQKLNLCLHTTATYILNVIKYVKKLATKWVWFCVSGVWQITFVNNCVSTSASSLLIVIEILKMLPNHWEWFCLRGDLLLTECYSPSVHNWHILTDCDKISDDTCYLISVFLTLRWLNAYTMWLSVCTKLPPTYLFW